MTITPSYGQFCPVAMASEIVCTRWTPLILRELLCGSTRFNELRRGLPLISTALLAKRLRQLVRAGIIRHEQADGNAAGTYQLTQAGEDLRGPILALGFWGQRWIEASVSLQNLDPTLLMWDIRRRVETSVFPRQRRVVQFVYPELTSAKRTFWLVVEDGHVDLCYFDPGFEVNLLVQTSVRTLTAIWMGLTSLAGERECGRIRIDGDADLARSMPDWLGLSVFAGESKRADAQVNLPA